MIKEFKLQAHPANIVVSVNDSDDFFNTYVIADGRWPRMLSEVKDMYKPEHPNRIGVYTEDYHNWVIRIAWKTPVLSPKKGAEVTYISTILASSLLAPMGVQMEPHTMGNYAHLGAFVSECIYKIIKDLNKKDD